MFQLHEQLKKDLLPLASLELCQVLLMPDSDNPWVVLVPQVNNIKEWHHLALDKQQILLKEINQISKILEQEFKPDKINIGALGNMVPQLHIHIICRYKNDKAWPGAIWGHKSLVDSTKLEDIKNKIQQKLI